MAVYGIAIMSGREGLDFETEIASDTAALNTFASLFLLVLELCASRRSAVEVWMCATNLSDKSQLNLREDHYYTRRYLRSCCL
jgi:hypothetical protein